VSDIDVGTVEALLDRAKIDDCIQRYANGIDRADKEMIASVIWPDAHIKIGDLDGTGADFVEWVWAALHRMMVTQHFLGRSLIRLDGTRAKAETYTRNWHTLRDDEGQVYDFLHGGRYLDTFAKRGDEWRLLDRYVMWDFAFRNDSPADLSHGAMGQADLLFSARYPEDKLYTVLGGLDPQLSF
jgi:hypothetical protein